LDANPAITVTNAHDHAFELNRNELRTITKIIVYLPGQGRAPDRQSNAALR
jgi:hypothetical protein